MVLRIFSALCFRGNPDHSSVSVLAEPQTDALPAQPRPVRPSLICAHPQPSLWLLGRYPPPPLPRVNLLSTPILGLGMGTAQRPPGLLGSFLGRCHVHISRPGICCSRVQMCPEIHGLSLEACACASAVSQIELKGWAGSRGLVASVQDGFWLLMGGLIYGSIPGLERWAAAASVFS